MPDKKVDITFTASTKAVSQPADITIKKKGNAKIEFDLSAPGLPSGASARIVGVEFPSTYTEPGGTFSPGSVFDNPHTITVAGVSHTVYGTAKSGSAKDLVLTDDDEVTAGEEDYPFQVWVEYKASATANAEYYASPDPEIKNKPKG